MTARTCPVCGKDMTGKRPHALVCSRSCKTVLSDRRRVADGRSTTRDRARYAREQEHRKAYAREYHRLYPEKTKAIRLRRKARLRGAAANFAFTARDWQRLVQRHRGCCAYCGVKGLPLQRDHVIPISRGGEHRIGNILPACATCNYGKKAKFLTEWRRQLQNAA